MRRHLKLSGARNVTAILVVILFSFGQQPHLSQTTDTAPDPAEAVKINSVNAGVKEARSSVSVAEEAERVASNEADTLAGLCGLAQVNETVMLDLEKLGRAVSLIAEGSLLKTPDPDEARLTAAQTKLQEAKNALPTTAPISAEVTRANRDAQTTPGLLAGRLISLKASKKKLMDALPRGFTCTRDFVANMSAELKPLKDSAPEADGASMLPVFNRSFDDLAQVIRFNTRTGALWPSMSGGLKKLGVKNDDELKSVNDSLTTLDKDIKDAGAKIPAWVGSLAAFAKTRGSAV
ncbi:MAG: hypothetical protein LC803_21645 [Acidobacteria bacterium]|nr:hypothetical protein [Acidobacteriota bacterium]